MASFRVSKTFQSFHKLMLQSSTTFFHVPKFYFVHNGNVTPILNSKKFQHKLFKSNNFSIHLENMTSSKQLYHFLLAQ